MKDNPGVERLWGSCEGNLVGGFIIGDPGRYVEKALETDISIGAPLGNVERGSYNGDVERRMEEGSRNGVSFYEGVLWGESGGGSFTGDPENVLSKALEMGICFHKGPAFGENGGTLS